MQDGIKVFIRLQGMAIAATTQKTDKRHIKSLSLFLRNEDSIIPESDGSFDRTVARVK